MAFNEQELAVIKAGIEGGKSRQEVERAIQNSRLGIKPSEGRRLAGAGERKSPLRALGDVSIGAGKGFLEGAIGLGRLATVAPERLGQAIIAGVDPTRTFGEVKAETGFTEKVGLAGPKADAIDEILRASNAEQRAGKIVGFVGEVGIGFSPLIGKGITKGATAVSGLVGRGTKALGGTRVGGAGEFVKEQAERLPRLGSRVREAVEQAGLRGERIKTGTPAVQNAIKSKLDDRFIVTVQNSDEATNRAYREMLDIAEDTGKGTLKPKQQPSIVAGRALSDQFDLLDTQRRTVGKQIGDIVDELSKTQKIDVLPEIRAFRIMLDQNGIRPVANGKLSFSGRFTPKERSAIQQAYDLATEGGEQLTPRQIYDFDHLFSKLQRESRFDGIGDIYLKTADGTEKNMFGAFRDIYSARLETLTPEIKALNKEYRLYRTVIDDVEDSIFKTPNFEATKVTDPAEFAKVNLRRIAGEAQSSPAYQAVVDEVDVLARNLGYTGARADDLTFFAQELRKLYPETIPSTGFTGGIKTGVSDLAQKVFKAGEPNVVDQQRALRGLLDEVLGSPQSFNKGVIPATRAVSETMPQEQATQLLKRQSESSTNSNILGRAIQRFKDTPNKQGGFAKIGGFGDDAVSKVGPVERETFEQFVDAVRVNRKVNLDLELKARKLAEDLGLSVEKTNAKLADDLTELLELNRTTARPVVAGQDLLTEAKKYKSADEFVKAHGETLYHGSDSGNVKFGKGGAFFTDTKRGAEEFGKAKKYVVSPKKTAEYLDQWDVLTENKSWLTKVGKGRGDDFKIKVTKDNIDTINRVYTKPKNIGDIESFNVNDPMWYRFADEEVVNILRKKGYDSVRYSDGSFSGPGGGIKELVVFDKSAIKTKSQLKEIWNKANK